MSNKKRRLPRHVDGRIKVGFVPLKKFLTIFLPVSIPVFILTLMNFTPVTMMLGFSIIGGTYALLSEFNQKETGLDQLIEYLRYAREGTIHFERSCINEPDVERLLRNKITKKEK